MITNNITQKRGKRDIFNIYLLFAISVFIVYFAPRIIVIGLQTIFLIVFFFSKKNYFWIAFVFIIENFPGSLFSRYTHDLQHTFSLLPESPSGTLYFWMLFILIALIKSLMSNSNYKLIFRINILILFTYFIFLIIVYGIYKYTAVIRTLLPWLFLIILPRLMKKEEHFMYFFNLVFSFMFFVFITQILQIFFGSTTATILRSSDTIFFTEEIETVVRPADGIFISYMSLLGALYYLRFKKKYFNKNYLIIITGFSIFSIFLTATRTWMLSTLFIIILYLIFIEKFKRDIIKRLVFPVIIIVLITQYISIVRQQIDLAIQRYSTIELVIEGDLTAGGTVKRFTERGPAVMAKFYEKPLIGWGIGNEAIKYSDGHVGYQNLLMHTGIIGFILWLMLWFNYIFKMFNLNKIISSWNPYKNIPILFIIFLFGILIINTSSQWFGYLLQFLPGFTIIFLLTFSSYVYQNSMQDEIMKKNANNFI